MSDQTPDPDQATAQSTLSLEGDALAAEPLSPEEQKQLEIERHRVRVLQGVHAFDLGTEEARVAALLNEYPDARDSDITLQLRYWEEHHGIGPDDAMTPRDLYTLPRLTSLTRARATIQNRLGLFKASTEVQEARGTLSDEERARVRRRQPSAAPVISVYADETGKQKDRLIVASVWVLVSNRSVRQAWPQLGRTRDQEFHFSDMARHEVEVYKAFTEFMLERAVAWGFKCLSVPRPAGNPDSLLEEMFARLLVDGMRHEIDTNRVALPRALQFSKDLDEPARDALACARLRDRLDAASAQQFGSELHTDTFAAVGSQYSVMMQLADLFAGSLNRALNDPGNNHKDDFARWFLGRIGYRVGAAALSDSVMHFDLGQGVPDEPRPGE